MVAAAVIGSAVVGGVASNMAANKAAGAQRGASDAAKLQSEISREQWDRYKQIYAPMEDAYAKEAQDYGSPERYAQEAGNASATVSDQFSKARDRLGRTPGLDPSSAAYTSQVAGLNLSQAAVDATQQNAARRNVQDAAWARKTDALSLGKGLPAQASAGASGAASTLGNIANGQLNYAGQIGSAIGNLGGNIMGAAGGFGSPVSSNAVTTTMGMNGVQTLTPNQMAAINL